jgi:hypothetical protein
MGTSNVFSTFDPTSLFAGEYPVRHLPVTIAQAGLLARGTVLGRRSIGTASSAPKSGGNTGNGTFVLDASTPELINVQSGLYTLRCTLAGANAATFRLTNPNGDVLGDYAFAGAGASVTVANQIKGVVTDGGTDFVVGDGFDITVAALDKYVVSVATANDGSQIPTAILAAAIDTTAGDLVGPAYFEGEFAAEMLTMDASWSVPTLQATLRQNNSKLFVRSVGTLG